MLSTLRSTALAAFAAAVFVPAVASAKDFCVNVAGCSSNYQLIQPALDAAAANPGADRVRIGTGLWTENLHASGDVTIEGSGPTTLLSQASYGPPAGSPFTLWLTGSGAVVRNLRIALPSGAGPRGLGLTNAARAENVTIDGSGTSYAIGVHATAGAHFSGSVDLPAGNNTGAYIDAGSGIVDARIAGAPAVYAQAGAGAAIVSRSTIVGRGGTVIDAVSGALTIEDTLVDARAPGAGAAVTTYATYAAALHKVDLRNVTLLGHGDDPQSRGIDARAFTATDAVTINARDSVVSNFGSHALYRIGGGTANLSLDHVDVFPASDVHEQGAGALTKSDVSSANPAFAPDGFTPAPGSPLIDSGNPGPLQFGESAVDLAGNPRIVAFGCDEPRRDLGAIEAVGQGCHPITTAASSTSTADVTPPSLVADTAAPRVTKLRILRRRAIRFTLSERARVTVRVSRAHRKPLVLRRAATGGRVTLKLKRILRHGRYAIRVIAVDGAGNRSAPAVVRRTI